MTKAHIFNQSISDKPTSIKTEHMMTATVRLVKIFNYLANDWMVKLTRFLIRFC